jgi:hypothetical protein
MALVFRTTRLFLNPGILLIQTRTPSDAALQPDAAHSSKVPATVHAFPNQLSDHMPVFDVYDAGMPSS